MISFTKMTAVRSAAACGLSGSRLRGIGLSSVPSVRPAVFAVLPLIEKRPGEAPGATAAQACAYEFAANGVGFSEATATKQQHQIMRAFRGLEPWRDPA
jgi:hypothetical protein